MVSREASPGSTDVDYDVVVVGAGLAGISALYTLRSKGLTVRLLEMGSRVGGTWYWNRYPGARVDIESLEYSYGFSDEIQQEWSWPERYAAQGDVQRYLEFVVDRLDLGGDLQLDTRVASASYDAEANRWTVVAERLEGVQLGFGAADATPVGEQTLVARYLVLATGFLSVPNLPDIPGLSDFKGDIAHTGAWPSEGVDYAGKRMGLIGTASSGVQIIQSTAHEVGRLSVFMRTANWCMPLRNAPIPPDYQAWVKANYADIRHLEHENRGFILVGGLIQLPDKRGALEVTVAEREQAYEQRWLAGGAHISRAFSDLLTNKAANDTLRDFLEKKIRSLVTDPKVADKLVPEHPPLSRRPPGEQGYYEAFNRDNVELIDIKADPIDHVAEDGVVLASGAKHEVDILVFATGFDAGRGAAMRIDIRGRDGLALKEHWADGTRTGLGLMSHGFPNMFFIDGPQSPAAFFLPPLLVDFQSKFVSEVIADLDALGGATLEPSADAEDGWSKTLMDLANATLVAGTDSWWVGTNIPGKPRRPEAYLGGFPAYRSLCRQLIDSDYAGWDVCSARVETSAAATAF